MTTGTLADLMGLELYQVEREDGSTVRAAELFVYLDEAGKVVGFAIKHAQDPSGMVNVTDEMKAFFKIGGDIRINTP